MEFIVSADVAVRPGVFFLLVTKGFSTVRELEF